MNFVNESGNILVTNGDLPEDYEIIGPVFFQITNRKFFSPLKKLLKKHAKNCRDGEETEHAAGNLWRRYYGRWCLKQSGQEKASFIAVEELKRRAALLGADAIINVRQHITVNPYASGSFHLQIYGTAVKRKKKD